MSFISPVPNEYEIQKLSGVWDTLMSMPHEIDYQTNAKSAKENTYYYLYTRPTIEFVKNYWTCEKPISEAIEVLQNLEQSSDLAFSSVAVLIFSCFMIIFFLIFHIIYGCNYGKNGCVEDMPPHKLLFTLIRTFFLFLTSLATFSMVTQNLVSISAKYHSYANWQEFHPCLDLYTEANNREVNSLHTIYLCSVFAFIFGLLILIPHTIFTVCQWILYCKH